jgi:hypothetical protein
MVISGPDWVHLSGVNSLHLYRYLTTLGGILKWRGVILPPAKKAEKMLDRIQSLKALVASYTHPLLTGLFTAHKQVGTSHLVAFLAGLSTVDLKALARMSHGFALRLVVGYVHPSRLHLIIPVLMDTQVIGLLGGDVRGEVLRSLFALMPGDRLCRVLGCMSPDALRITLYSLDNDGKDFLCDCAGVPRDGSKVLENDKVEPRRSDLGREDQERFDHLRFYGFELRE